MQGPAPSREAGAEDRLASGGWGPGHMALWPESVSPQAPAVWGDALSFPPRRQLVVTSPLTLPSRKSGHQAQNPPRLWLVPDHLGPVGKVVPRPPETSVWSPDTVRMLGPGARKIGGPYVVLVFIARCQARATSQRPSWAADFPEV